MNYKGIIRSQRLRFKVLYYLRFIPDSIMLRLQYRIKMGFWPNFKHPKRFTEKLQLYKMRYRNPIMPMCVDKYEVRKYVENKGLGNILNDCYGVYDSVKDIDLGKLPNQFVAKTTDGGGGLNVVLVKDKGALDVNAFESNLSLWNRRKSISPGREWAYNGIGKSRIVIERLLVDELNEDGSIEDYKFLCFNGRFQYLWIDKNRYSNHKRGFWNRDLQFLQGVESDHPTFDVPPILPFNINEMISIVEKLSEDFPFARIDLYNIQGEIIFGEITFYPWSGYVKYVPDSFDFELGNCFAEY